MEPTSPGPDPSLLRPAEPVACAHRPPQHPLGASLATSQARPMTAAQRGPDAGAQPPPPAPKAPQAAGSQRVGSGLRSRHHAALHSDTSRCDAGLAAQMCEDTGKFQNVERWRSPECTFSKQSHGADKSHRVNRGSSRNLTGSPGPTTSPSPAAGSTSPAGAAGSNCSRLLPKPPRTRPSSPLSQGRGRLCAFHRLLKVVFL